MSVDLSTTYLGLKLANPIVASASPLTGDLNSIHKLEDAGVAAIVLPSLFEEQIEHEEMEQQRLQEFASESFAEALSYLPDVPDMQEYNTGPDGYLRQLEAAKLHSSLPVIASLNGSSQGGWLRYAKMIQDAGADALELNIYFLATDPESTSLEVETQYLDLVGEVRQSVSIPLAVKIGPYFSAMANMAVRLVDAGADGLVLFNRFLQPDIDLQSLTVKPDLELSTGFELRLPLRWTAILRGRVQASLAVTSGVQSADDVLKAVLAGADVCMLASVLLRRGPESIATMLASVSDWLEANEYASIEQMKGSMSQENCPDPAAFERANYMAALKRYTSDIE